MPASLRPLALSAGLLLALAAGLYGTARISREAPQSAAAGVADWEAWLAGLPDEGFERASGAWQLELPRDHGAHATARMETWNIAAHLSGADGERVGVQFALLRVGLRPPYAAEPGTPWELREVYRGHVALLTADRPVGEERFSRAVPGTAGYNEELREIRLDDWSLRFGQGESGTELRLHASVAGTPLELLLTPAKPAMAAAPEGGAPFRGYSLTRLDVRGSLGGGGAPEPVSGLAWLDHQCASRFDKTFLECTDAERREVLDDIAWPAKARPEMKPGASFFSGFRDLTASGFWSSKMGIEDLQYQGNTFVAEWRGCPPEVLKRLGLEDV